MLDVPRPSTVIVPPVIAAAARKYEAALASGSMGWRPGWYACGRTESPSHRTPNEAITAAVISTYGTDTSGEVSETSNPSAISGADISSPDRNWLDRWP